MHYSSPNETRKSCFPGENNLIPSRPGPLPIRFEERGSCEVGFQSRVAMVPVPQSVPVVDLLRLRHDGPGPFDIHNRLDKPLQTLLLRPRALLTCFRTAKAAVSDKSWSNHQAFGGVNLKYSSFLVPGSKACEKTRPHGLNRVSKTSLACSTLSRLVSSRLSSDGSSLCTLIKSSTIRSARHIGLGG